MANTSIQIKRSETNGKPVSLNSGELAYSYASNTIFIGTPNGNGVVNVGGQYYTSQIDNSTSASTGDTLVKRDGSGNASFNTIYGALGTSTGVTPNTYGDATHIPIVTVGANGLVTGVTTSEISTTLGLDSEFGSNTMSLLTGTLKFYGGEGINTSIDANTSNVKFEVDTTVVRSNTAITLQTIDGSIEINGNLTVLGTSTTVNTESLNIADPLIYLASNNYTSDVVDIGFAANYFDGQERHTGVFRNAGDKEFYVFDNYLPELSSNNEIDIADDSFHVANLHANLISGFVNTTTARIDTANVVNDLGVDGNSYLNNLNVDGTTTLVGQANTTNDLGVGGNLYVSGSANVTTDLFVTGTTTLTGQANTTNNLGVGGDAYVTGNLTVSGHTTLGTISLDGGDISANNLTANTLTLRDALTVPNGGTGQQSFTVGSILVGNGSGALGQLSNTTFVATGSGASNNTITSATVDAYGRFTDVTYNAISGLKVNQGGTGQASFTLNGMIFGNGSGDLQYTTAAGTADQTWSNQILTTTNAGVPVWTTALDGGTF